MLCPVFQISPLNIGPMTFCKKRHRLWDSQAWTRCLNTTQLCQSIICIFGVRVSIWRLGTAYSCIVFVSSAHTEGELKFW